MKIFITVIITLVATIIVLVGIGVVIKAKGQKSNSNAAAVRLEKPTEGDLIEFINAPGEIRPKHQVDISARISARIVEMPYKVGDRVTKGDPSAAPPIEPSLLLRLDASDLEAGLQVAEARRAAQAAQIEVSGAEIESRKAGMEGNRAQLEQAHRELKRQKSLFESRDVSQSDVDDAQSRVDDLEAQLASLEHGLNASRLQLEVLGHNLEGASAEISRAREQLRYTVITSPIDGLVTKINAEVGEMVMTGTMNNPGTVILEVADLSQILVKARVDESDVGKVETGQRAKVHIHAWLDEVFEGVVDTIALTQSTERDGTKYFETEIILADSEKKIYSGLTADVDIEIKEHKNILKIPSQAVLGCEVDELPLEIRENCAEVDKEKTYAAVVYKYVEGEAIVTPVKIGESDASHTVVLAGITREDEIVVGPYKVLEKIKHKQKIKIEQEEKEGQEEG